MRRGLLCLLLLLSACVGPPAADASGEEVYAQICARCHGSDLSGGVGPALGPGSNAATQADEFIVLTVTRGRGRMPSFGSTLTSEQIDRVVAFLREQQG